MKPTIENLRDTFKYSYEEYEESRVEATEVWDAYHNRQYTSAQLALLQNRGQPAETFNVVKLFSRMLLGYYSTTVNTIVAQPQQITDVTEAALVNDCINYVIRKNNFPSAEGEKVKLSGIISGLMCTYESVKKCKETDEFGRPFIDIAIEHVPEFELVLDPMSISDDYSDARFIHRFRWLSDEGVADLLGKKALEKLDSYANTLEVEEAEFEFKYNGQFQGYYKLHDNYLIIHSIVRDGEDFWSCYWSGEVLLKKTKLAYTELKFPYRVTKVHPSDKVEYYGIFREIKESQKAINQALIKLQLMVNTEKVYVEDNAVENIAAFTNAVNRVSGVIPVKALAGIRVENMAKDVLDQYTIIDKALDRIQRILGINDSFLGMAYASDSGRKVKLQQNAAIVALRYLTGRIESFYRYLGWDIAKLIKQYWTAHQVLRIGDPSIGERWIEVNQPLMQWTGQYDQMGQPVMEPVFEEVVDPETGEHMEDEEGNLLFAPVPAAGTDLTFTDVDIEIISTSYNDEDEKNQLMLETILNGHVGSMLAQVNPAGFFQAASLSMRSVKTKHSPDVVRILEQTAQMLSGNPMAQQEASMMAQGGSPNQNPMSQELKLPQNTNEGFGQ